MTLYREITLGSRIKTATVAGITVSEVVHAPNAELKPHSHENPNISLVLQGGFEETVDDQSYRVGAASVVFKPRGTVHHNRYGRAGARSMVLEFTRDSQAWTWWEDTAGTTCRWIMSGPCIASAIRAYARSFCNGKSSAGRIQKADLLDDITELLSYSRLEGVECRARTASPVVRKAKNMVKDGFRQGIDIQTIAADIGVHPVYLARAFRKEFGCALTDYRRRLQIGEAAVRLAKTTQPLVEIAVESGFADQSHLSRVFKSQTGLTPGTYRRLVSTSAPEGGAFVNDLT